MLSFGLTDLVLVVLSQGKQAITLQKLSCSDPVWTLSRLNATEGRDEGQAATSSRSVPCDTTLQPRSQASLFFYLHRSHDSQESAGEPESGNHKP